MACAHGTIHFIIYNYIYIYISIIFNNYILFISHNYAKADWLSNIEFVLIYYIYYLSSIMLFYKITNLDFSRNLNFKKLKGKRGV